MPAARSRAKRGAWRVLAARQDEIDLAFFQYRFALRSELDLSSENPIRRYNVAGHTSVELGHCRSVLNRLLTLAPRVVGKARAGQGARLLIRQDHELWMLVEAFYLFAWRVIERISEKAKTNDNQCPLLQRGKVRGITTVRNNLLQHPTEAGVNSPNTLWIDANTGPVLKAIRQDYYSKTDVDPGFFLNVVEFQDRVCAALNVFRGARGQQPIELQALVVDQATDYSLVLGPIGDREYDA
ncbi:hypothetical protein [Luteitalea sp.]